MRSCVRYCREVWSSIPLRSESMPRPLAWGFFVALVLLSVALPAAAQSVPDSPTLSTTDRLDERRFVVAGPRAYEVGTEAGRYPAMGFHTRGEMGGILSPPIKVLVGLRFAAAGAEQAFDLTLQAHSELISAYPWGETKASGQPFTQLEVNLQ